MAVQSTIQVVLMLVSSFAIEGKTDGVRECPPWFKWVNTTDSHFPHCVCSQAMSDCIDCNQENQQSSLKPASCVFYDSDSDEVVAALCPFLFPKHMLENGVVPLPTNVSELNAFVCGNLRREVEGPLCGKCTKGTGPSIYSTGNECVRCSPVNVAYYLLLQYLPTTLLVLAVIVFRLNVTAAPMAHFVLFCNIIVLFNKFIVGVYTGINGTSNLGKLVLTLTAVWSFDALFFVSPPLCISPHFEDIYKPFVDFLATLYPFILLLLTYAGTELHARNFTPVVILWRPFHRIYVRFYSTWEPNASMIQAFSSLFFLSYAKVHFLMGVPYLWTTVKNVEGNMIKQMVYIDPTVQFLAKKHIYLIPFSLFIGIFLFLPPLVLLVIYPTSLYRKISHRLKPRWRLAIKAYVETFQGCYKDGTNGTRDYRAISGYILAMGALLLIAQAIIALVSNTYPLQASIIFFTVLTIIFALLQPYKHRVSNTSAVTLLALLTAIFALFSFVNATGGSDVTRVLMLVLMSSPHCVLYGYVVWKIIRSSRNTDNVRAQLVPRPINTASNYTNLSDTASVQ